MNKTRARIRNYDRAFTLAMRRVKALESDLNTHWANNVEADGEQLVLHTTRAKLTKNGATIEARCIGTFTVEGVKYEFNRVAKFAAKKVVP